MANLGYLQLTRRCVQSCRFCSNPPTGRELHEDELHRLVDDLVDRGYDGIILTGGEPTLSPLLLPALAYARQRGLAARVITNGQLLADRARFEEAVDNGLSHLHLSLHSHLPEVHDFITRNTGSHARLVQCLSLVPEMGVSCDINTVICAWNVRTLDATAAWVVERFPFVRHFVWNNLDPHNDSVRADPSSVSRLRDFEVALDRAMALLTRTGRTFRVERVPLCAMRRHPEASTETRKIVKEEQRLVRFLDGKGLVVKISTSLDGDLGFTDTPASSGEYTAGGYLTEGTHLVTAKVYDTYGRSDQDTITIEIYAHGPPSVDTVSILPSPPTTIDPLVANPQGWEDKDGAAAKYHYAWYKADYSGTMVVDVGEATDTYPSGKTTKGDLYQVEVTPYNDYGDGTPKTSPTVEIQNSPPSAPGVQITPSSPQPEDNLQCGITAASSDADLDIVSYSYQWFQNGALTSLSTYVVTASYTANVDTWECVVTPNDGEEDGTSGSASVTVSDVTAPDAPLIDTPYEYRNDDSATLTGTCEPACTLTFYCADALTSWTDSGTCDSAGEFEYNTSLTRGQTTECYATCEDSAGNVSTNSNTVSTEVCDPYDGYEDASGYGDAGSDAIDEWATLADNGTTTISIEANVLNDDTDDWYVVSTTDDISSDYSAGIDYYNFAVDMVDGTSDYAFIVYRGTPDPTDQECPTTSSGYTEYNDFVQDKGDGSHAIPADTRSCSSSSASYNDCNDMSNEYYLQVFRRRSRVTSCQHYELEITNGVW